MKIGFVFDVKEDYGLTEANNSYMDFHTRKNIAQIAKELKLLGHETTLIGNIRNFLHLDSYNQFDIIFNISEGYKTRNREGIAPSVFELLDVPYIGSDSFALSLSLNKYHAKLLVNSLDICTPKSLIINECDAYADKLQKWINHNRLDFPIVSKPNSEGNSSGIILNHNLSELESSIKYSLDVYKNPVLCEEFIDGKEITVPIIKTDTVYITEVIEFVCKNKPVSFYNYELKHSSDVIPVIADIDNSIRKKIIEDSIKIFESFQCLDYARVDFKLNQNGHYFLELNPIPELTEISSFATLASANAISYGQLIEIIVKASHLRQNI